MALDDLVQAKLNRRPRVKRFAESVSKTHGVGIEDGRIRFYRKDGDLALAIKTVASGDITIVNNAYRIIAGGTGFLQFGGPNSALGRDMILERIRIAIKASGGSPYIPNSSPQPLMLVSAGMKNGAPQLFPQDNDPANGVGSATIERFLVGTPAGYAAPSDGSEDDEPLGYIDATRAYLLKIVNYDTANACDFTCDGSVV